MPLPNGQRVPIGVTSFAMVDQQRAFMVMSTPSVWRAHGVDNPVLGLETMMIAVLLHEGSHVAQAKTYAARMSEIAVARQLPEDFNDDAIQLRFQSDAAFAASVANESELLFDAARALDIAEAVRLAQQARALMRKRADRFFVGDDQWLAEVEDVWLTMEGSGQWAGFSWVIDARGAGVARDVALANFARTSWWSQKEGFALFLVLDRLDGGAWRKAVFGGGPETVLKLLDRALATHAAAD